MTRMLRPAVVDILELRMIESSLRHPAGPRALPVPGIHGLLPIRINSGDELHLDLVIREYARADADISIV